MRASPLGRRAANARRGSALLDVAISLALLGLSGTTMLALLDQTEHSMRQVRATERELRQASDELGRLAMLDRPRLAALTGQSVRHGWLLVVTERTSGLFDVAIADTVTRSTLLRTTLYRVDTSRADPIE